MNFFFDPTPMTPERFFSLAGNGLFCLFVLAIILLCLAFVVLWVLQYIFERGWKRIWREIVATVKVISWAIIIIGGILAIFAGVGWLIDHFLQFNVTTLP